MEWERGGGGGRREFGREREGGRERGGERGEALGGSGPRKC